MKTYKLVEGPTTSQILSEEGNNEDAIESFETIIAEQSQQGWRYHSMEPITTERTEGCISKTTVRTTFYMLIFEKD